MAKTQPNVSVSLSVPPSPSNYMSLPIACHIAHDHEVETRSISRTESKENVARVGRQLRVAGGDGRVAKASLGGTVTLTLGSGCDPSYLGKTWLPGV